ncbi:migration and invasion inhibitory protein [Odontesthes bonariensis]|uniref:migration and invasion inhibitory protein n=1 Tax=Odontesthes bonariensis TaxID=219752 RepID=UPI003F58D1E6
MFTDQLDALRERNKHLLTQLRQQREKLERPSSCGPNRKRGREDADEERRKPEVMVTLTDGYCRPARKALAKPSVRFADTCATQRGEMQRGIQHPVSAPSGTTKYRGVNAENTTLSELLEDSHESIQVHTRLQGGPPHNANSCPVRHSNEQTVFQSRVTFQPDEREDIPGSDRHRLGPLLGYDWIAGVLDTEDSLVERSDEFFDDLRVFRSLNKDECVRTTQAEFSEESHRVPSLLTAKDDPEPNKDAHQCIFSYRINSRLFPVPLHSQECCPVCKKHKSSHPHTAAEPALIRVSIPCVNLLPPYKYKAHRRCSFDTSESLGLPSHCLSGWSNKGQSSLSPPSSLDLRSSLKMKNSDESLKKEVEDLSASKVFGGQRSGQISDVSCLPRHNFQHFSPNRKMGSTSYPLC